MHTDAGVEERTAWETIPLTFTGAKGSTTVRLSHIKGEYLYMETQMFAFLHD